MKKLLLFIAILISGMGLFAQNNYQYRIATFMSEDGFETQNYQYSDVLGTDLKGIHEIDLFNENETIDSLVYDENGNIISLQTYLLLDGQWLKVCWVDYTYNEMGLRATRTNYNDFHDGLGPQIGGVYYYTYNDNGQLIQRDLDFAGCMYEKATYSYKDNGQLEAELIMINPFTGVYENSGLTEYYYDENGYLTESLIYLWDGTSWGLQESFIQEYDEAGNCIVAQKLNAAGNVIIKKVYKYNDTISNDVIFHYPNPEEKNPVLPQMKNMLESYEYWETDVDYNLCFIAEYTFSYDEVIYNDEPITNHWLVDESSYADNMAVIGEIYIDSVNQETTSLEIGAFCGEELRGSQLVQYIPELDKYLVFLMIYGEANDEITFKLYDHSAGKELELLSPDAVTFSVNGTLGSVDSPYILNFNPMQQTATLTSGWNWFSSYIEISGAEGLEMIENALGENGLLIKNQRAFVANSIIGWQGTLTEFDVKDMYMIQTSDACALTLSGDKVIPENHPITIGTNWRWISYPVSESISVEEALATIVPSHGDYIKSQNLFSQYYDGIGWVGGINTMTPGEGYMYQNTSGTTKTLVYPLGASSKERKANVTSENNHWIADAGRYANNMSMIAFVKDNLETEYEIGAFVGEELRGSARPIYIEALDSYLIFMTIYGESNEEVTFRYYDVNADAEETVFTKENVMFSTNATYGSVDNPIAMMFDTEGLGENGMENISIYPNPANVNSEINLGMTCDRVEIYNTLGVKIAEYSNVNKIDGMETAGVYMIRVMNDNGMRNYRVVVE